MEIGSVVKVWDNKYNRIEDAKLLNVRYNVKASFDNHVYPSLYDVKFIHDNRISNGHLEIE